MTRSKILTLLAGFLLLTNIALLVYFLVLKPGGRSVPGKYGGLEALLRKELQFTDAQVAQFGQMKEQHFAQMKPLMDSIQAERDRLYNMIGNSFFTDSALSSATRRISERQAVVDAMTFRHFQRLRTICTPAQLPGFDTMVQRMSKRMGGRFGKMRKGKGGG
jgi:periplasmic protein CpxP/Spy